MRNEKKYPRKQLEKYSTIFMQLSLVLVLFVVYQIIEYETVEKRVGIIITETIDNYMMPDEENIVNYVKEKKVTPKKAKPKVLILDLIDPKKNDDIIIEDLLPDDKLIEDVIIDIDTALDNYIQEIVPPTEDVPFILIEDAPIYKGCEGLTKEENKKCFISSIQKFVIKRFNVDLAQELGLREGKYKIYVQFIISKKGNVTGIKIKAPHHKLEKEVNRIVEKLPRFTPGKQRTIPVNVKFTLPISFQVQ